jgi:hypothetical protein
MKRNVTIHPNLAAWLRAYPLDRFPIIPANLQHTRAAAAKAFDLSHDVMRHTFISMHVAKFRSMGEAALQAGNSESIIRQHYLDLKTSAEADRFFEIKPVLRRDPLDIARARSACQASRSAREAPSHATRPARRAYCASSLLVLSARAVLMRCRCVLTVLARRSRAPAISLGL